jgi:hypothetical protein
MVYVPNLEDYRDTIGFNNLLEGQESNKLSIFDVPKGYVSPPRKTRRPTGRNTRKPSRRSSFRKEMIKYVNQSNRARKSSRQLKQEIMQIQQRHNIIPAIPRKSIKQVPVLAKQVVLVPTKQVIVPSKQVAVLVKPVISAKQYNQNNLLQLLNHRFFHIIKNAGGGDCFFHSVSQALKYQNKRLHYVQIGLRRIIANATTVQMFKEYDIQQWQLFIANDPRGITYIKQLYGNNYNKNTVKEIRTELNKPEKIQHTIKINRLIESLHDLQRFPAFNDYLLSSNYWADTFAINMLRQLLNTQFIIFDSKKNNINCILNFDDKKHKYDGYILIWWTSPTHYELIEYADPEDKQHKREGYFTFNSLPMIIKQLINQAANEEPECNNDINFPLH